MIKAMLYDVLISGGGIGGLTAAVYCARAGLKTVIFEKDIWGGQIASAGTVENYPGFEKISGSELSALLALQAEKANVVMKNDFVRFCDLASKIKRSFAAGAEYLSKTVILANGCERKRAGFEGEREFVGKGVSYCAVCDGPLFKDREVFIVGGGNTAAEGALYLSKTARKVNMVVRKGNVRCSLGLKNKIESVDNIEIMAKSTVKYVSGDEFVGKVCVQNISDNTEKVFVSEKSPFGVFVFVGHTPATAEFSEYIKLDFDGYIDTGEDCKTNINGVFACGDVRKKPLRQLVTAAADGALCAEAAQRYISENF